MHDVVIKCVLLSPSSIEGPFCALLLSIRSEKINQNTSFPVIQNNICLNPILSDHFSRSFQHVFILRGQALYILSHRPVSGSSHKLSPLE